MATVSGRIFMPPEGLELHSGDRMNREEFHIRTFPGLWIHAEALLAKDYRRLRETLEQGLATADHADFVGRLAAARSDGSTSDDRS